MKWMRWAFLLVNSFELQVPEYLQTKMNMYTGISSAFHGKFILRLRGGDCRRVAALRRNPSIQRAFAPSSASVAPEYKLECVPRILHVLDLWWCSVTKAPSIASAAHCSTPRTDDSRLHPRKGAVPTAKNVQIWRTLFKVQRSSIQIWTIKKSIYPRY